MTADREFAELAQMLEPAFLARVNRAGPESSRSGLGRCWTWTGIIDRQGYGRLFAGVQVAGRRRILPAHRVAYALLVGPIPDGLVIDHLCRNRACVNPEHMEPVANETNVLRGESPAAKAARRTHCRAGHPFDATNTRVNGDGSRSCITCHNAGQRRRYRERQARKAS